MPWLDILKSQLMDPFRIALLIALVFTMWRNRAVTGTVVPLLAGMLFVAVIIPATISAPGLSGVSSGEGPMATSIARWRAVLSVPCA